MRQEARPLWHPRATLLAAHLLSRLPSPWAHPCTCILTLNAGWVQLWSLIPVLASTSYKQPLDRWMGARTLAWEVRPPLQAEAALKSPASLSGEVLQCWPGAGARWAQPRFSHQLLG